MQKNNKKYFLMGMVLMTQSLLGASLSKQEKQTIEYYDNHAQEWVESRKKRDGVSFWQDEINQFHSMLSHGKILEVGCGDGKEATEFLNKKYDYIGIDASVGLLEIARQKNSAGVFKQAYVQDLQFPSESFDGFWTAAVLLHIPRVSIGEALASIHNVIKNNALGFISLKEGTCDMLDEPTGRYFTMWTEETFTDVLHKQGFVVEKFFKKQGARDVWLCYFVRKIDIESGQVYQHYKGKNYRIVGIARHSETLEELVVYQALYESEFGKDTLWVRPKSMFYENVMVDGIQKRRFRPVEL